MTDLEAGVPHGVPQLAKQFLVGLATVGMDEHDIEVAVWRQDAPPVPAHRHETQTGRVCRGCCDHLVVQPDQPGVDCRTPRPAAEFGGRQQRGASVSDHARHRRTRLQMAGRRSPTSLRRPYTARMRLRVRTWIALVCAVIVAVAACSPSDSAPPTTTVGDTTVDTAVTIEDGELQLGVLLPLSGVGTEIGSSMRDA